MSGNIINSSNMYLLTRLEYYPTVLALEIVHRQYRFIRQRDFGRHKRMTHDCSVFCMIHRIAVKTNYGVILLTHLFISNRKTQASASFDASNKLHPAIYLWLR